MPQGTETLKLEYVETLFADREEEIERALQIAATLRTMPLRKPPTIFISGFLGLGKTWLLRHLCNLLEKEGDFTFYIDLTASDGEGEQGDEEKVASIIKGVSDEIADHSNTRPTYEGKEAPTLDELGRWMAAELEELLKAEPSRIVVACVDHIDQVSWEFLEKLETHFLVPLAKNPRSLLFLAGRMLRHPWKAPEIRLNYAEWPLGKFDEGKSKEQIDKLQKELGTKVRRDWQEIRSLVEGEEYSYFKELLGHPLVNYFLAVTERPEDALQDFLSWVLSSVPRELHEPLREISVLRAFDEARIVEVLPEYRDKPYVEARELRQKLQDTRLVRWDPKSHGYIVDTGLRPFLEASLRSRKPELWEELHKRALEMYGEWAQDPRSGEYWKEEAEYHRKCIESANGG